jgi:TadE-like protein
MSRFNRGAVLVELVLILPILVLFSFGCFEIHNQIQVQNYLLTTSYRLALWTSMNADYATNVPNYFTQLIAEGAPYNMAANGTLIITGLVTAGSTTTNSIRWYRAKNASLNSGNMNHAATAAPVGYGSVVTTTYPKLYFSGTGSTTPTTIQTIVVEVIYNYTPLYYSGLGGSKTLRYTIPIDYRGTSFPSS